MAYDCKLLTCQELRLRHPAYHRYVKRRAICCTTGEYHFHYGRRRNLGTKTTKLDGKMLPPVTIGEIRSYPVSPNWVQNRNSLLRLGLQPPANQLYFTHKRSYFSTFSKLLTGQGVTAGCPFGAHFTGLSKGCKSLIVKELASGTTQQASSLAARYNWPSSGRRVRAERAWVTGSRRIALRPATVTVELKSVPGKGIKSLPETYVECWYPRDSRSSCALRESGTMQSQRASATRRIRD